MERIIQHSPNHYKNFSSQPSDGSCQTTNLDVHKYFLPYTCSDEAITKARSIKLRKTKHHFIMLIGRLIESGANRECRASHASLSYMLIESIGKHLKRTAMQDLSKWIDSSGVATRSQKDGSNNVAYEYRLNEVGWAYYHIHKYRIPKREDVFKNRPPPIQKPAPHITKSINEEKYLNKYQPILEISRQTHSDDKEVGRDLMYDLENRLTEVNAEVAEKVREQVRKYMSKTRIKYPDTFFPMIINREVKRFYNRFEAEERQQQEFRARAHAEMRRVEDFVERKENPSELKLRLNALMAECRRRSEEQ